MAYSILGSFDPLLGQGQWFDASEEPNGWFDGGNIDNSLQGHVGAQTTGVLKVTAALSTVVVGAPAVTTTNLPTTGFYWSIAYGAGIYLAVGHDVTSSNLIVATSTDGQTWTNQSSSAPTTSAGQGSGWTAIYSAAAAAFLVTNSGGSVQTPYIYKTSNGTSWTTWGNIVAAGLGGGYLYQVNGYSVYAANNTTPPVFTVITNGSGGTSPGPTIPAGVSSGGNAVTSIAYGPGGYVINLGMYIITMSGMSAAASANYYTSASSTSYNGQVVYGEGIYLVGGVGQGFASSTDGMNWTDTASYVEPNIAPFQGGATLLFGNGAFFCGGGGAYGYASTDGVTWFLQRYPQSAIADTSNACFANNTFFLPSNNTAGASLIAGTSFFSSPTAWSEVIQANGLYDAVLNFVPATQRDGFTQKSGTNPASASPIVLAIGSRVVVVSAGVATQISDDFGRTWNSGSTISANSVIGAALYDGVNGWNFTVFIDYTGANATTTPAAYVSSAAGTTEAAYTYPVTSGATVTSVAWANLRLVVQDSLGTTKYSFLTQGFTSSAWTTIVTGVTQNTLGAASMLALTSGAWVQVGVLNSNGHIGTATSPDWATWTTTDQSATITDASYGGYATNGTTVVILATTHSYTSTDGITFTQHTLPFTSSNSKTSLVYTGSYFCTFVGSTVWYSTDGVTWNSYVSPITIGSVTTVGGLLVLVPATTTQYPAIGSFSTGNGSTSTAVASGMVTGGPVGAALAAAVTETTTPSAALSVQTLFASAVTISSTEVSALVSVGAAAALAAAVSEVSTSSAALSVKTQFASSVTEVSAASLNSAAFFAAAVSTASTTAPVLTVGARFAASVSEVSTASLMPSALGAALVTIPAKGFTESFTLTPQYGLYGGPGIGQIVYGNGNYVALNGFLNGISEETGFIVSTDGGRTFSNITLPQTGNHTNLTFGNGYFLASIGSTQTFTHSWGYSTDGVNWTWNANVSSPANLGHQASPNYLIFLNGNFFQLSGVGGTIQIQGVGTDPLLNTSYASLIIDYVYGLNALQYGNGVYLLLTTDGYSQTATTPTGTWTRSSSAVFTANYPAPTMYWTGSQWWGVDGVYTYTSTDGLNWTKTARAAQYQWSIAGGAYCNGTYIIVPFLPLDITASTVTPVFYSTDGVTWNSSALVMQGAFGYNANFVTPTVLNSRFAVFPSTGADTAANVGATLDLGMPIPTNVSGATWVTASASLTAAARFSAAVTITSTEVSTLTSTGGAGAALAAVVSEATSTAAALTTGIPVSAATTDVSVVSATITTNITLLAAVAEATVSAAGLTTGITLTATAVESTTSVAVLAGQTLFAAAGVELTTETAALSAQALFSAAVGIGSFGSPAITTGITLGASVTINTTESSAMAPQANFVAAIIEVTAVVAGLTTRAQFAALGVVSAGASATLIYEADILAFDNNIYTVLADPRTYLLLAESRSLSIVFVPAPALSPDGRNYAVLADPRTQTVLTDFGTTANNQYKVLADPRTTVFLK